MIPSIDQILSFISYNAETGAFTRVKSSINAKSKIGERTDTLNSKGHGYRRVCVCNKRFAAHSLAMYIHYGVWPQEEVDHINGDRGDNRIANLRYASKQSNCLNKRTKTGTTGVRGVYYNPRCKKPYETCVAFAGKRYGRERFDTLQEAQEYVRKIRAYIHGQFANHG